MQPKHLQEMIKTLQEFYKCPSCETNYHFDDIRVLGEMDPYCFIQLSCHNCSLPILATWSADDKKPSKGKTDLRHTEEAKFATKGAITASEIAEFHRWLSKGRKSFKSFKS